jgi:hypothetical protein
MRATGPFLALGTLTLLSAAPALAQGFEGAVTYHMNPEHPMDMTMSIKGDKIRSDMSGMPGGQQMFMLMDLTALTMTTVMPDHKMYMTMDMKGMQAMQHGDKPQHPPKITATGQKETLAGRSCDDYQITSDDGKTVEICAAKGMGNFMAPQGGPMGGRGGQSPLASLNWLRENPEWAKLAADGFFPLKVSNVEGGKKSVVMEATKVEQKSLDASLFQVPAGFSEMKMGGMQHP